MIIFFRKNKIVLSILLLACMLLSIFEVIFTAEIIEGKENLKMYSNAYALTDGETGRLLAGKAADNPMANASTTKILTCIVALENCSMEEMVTISKNASAQPSVRLGVKTGEQYPLGDLLYGLMLESYNDCAVAIAEHVAGSVQNFSYLLNEKAKKIGCKDTHFITPNGLDAVDEKSFHHSTASDLCKIMAYCVWESPLKEAFLKITQTASYSGNANGKSYSFTNHNALLSQMDGVISGKTGYTAKAGYCYVAAFEKGKEKYCIALLACGWPNNKTYKWKDARTLLDYGYETYDYKTIKVEKITEYMTVKGFLGEPDMSELNVNNKMKLDGKIKSYNVLLGESDKVDYEIVLYTDSELPIEKGQTVGECKIYINQELLDSYPLTASSVSNRWNFERIFHVIIRSFWQFSA